MRRKKKKKKHPHLTRTVAKQPTKQERGEQEGGSSRGRGFVHRQPLLSFSSFFSILMYTTRPSATTDTEVKLCFPSAATDRPSQATKRFIIIRTSQTHTKKNQKKRAFALPAPVFLPKVGRRVKEKKKKKISLCVVRYHSLN